ncbi:MAG: TRAP transporter small permease [Solibacillus sp.]|uniref:TRAP transporter small permease n=1 Tax=unclassified Solibacillus TaxID=2637870 RepID=UPI0030F704B2
MKKLLLVFNNIERALITIMMMIMVVLIFTQVFTRYVLGSSLGWTEEASRYLFIWLIFLSIGIAFVDKKHISIDILLDMLPRAFQKLILQISYVCLMGLSIFLFMQGMDLVSKLQQFAQKSSTLQIPMWMIYLSLPVGFLVAFVRLIHVSILLYVKKEDEKESEVNPIV